MLLPRGVLNPGFLQKAETVYNVLWSRVLINTLRPQAVGGGGGGREGGRGRDKSNISRSISTVVCKGLLKFIRGLAC